MDTPCVQCTDPGKHVCDCFTLVTQLGGGGSYIILLRSVGLEKQLPSEQYNKCAMGSYLHVVGVLHNIITLMHIIMI